MEIACKYITHGQKNVNVIFSWPFVSFIRNLEKLLGKSMKIEDEKERTKVFDILKCAVSELNIFFKLCFSENFDVLISNFEKGLLPLSALECYGVIKKYKPNRLKFEKYMLRGLNRDSSNIEWVEDVGYRAIRAIFPNESLKIIGL